MSIQKILGGRVLKTGLSVLITAAICQALQLPVMFAVIAAIVTIEPTAAASVKKGMIRLPAAAIGSGFAMFFDYLFGQVPVTYALAAVFTILVCHRLHWDDAILVATLTAVAMIPETEDHFLMAFFTRLATTSIGIIVSSLVNLFVLPPQFGSMISNLKNDLYFRSASLIRDSVRYALYHEGNRKQLRMRFNRLSKDLERTFQYIQYQREEWGYRRHSMSDIRKFTAQQKELDLLQKMMYHIGNLISTESLEEQKDCFEKIEDAARMIADAVEHHDRARDQLNQVSTWLRKIIKENEREIPESSEQEAYFSNIVLVCYELLAIAQVMHEHKKIHRYLEE
ncbi:MAG: FUSC family protein [Bacillaceae bacterium]|nr:FUSC family protein [Bacillaceae bacterium]